MEETTWGRTQAVPGGWYVAHVMKNCEGWKGRKRGQSCSSGRECKRKRDRKGEREREREKERIGEREGGRKHHTRFLGVRMLSVGPVSRFVSDWCRVRGSRESTARAARCVPLRPGGHVTRSPAGGRTAHSASKSGRTSHVCCVAHAGLSRARVGRIAWVLEEEEKEREREEGEGGGRVGGKRMRRMKRNNEDNEKKIRLSERKSARRERRSKRTRMDKSSEWERKRDRECSRPAVASRRAKGP